MAMDYSGLFQTPESIRMKRLDALESQAGQQRMMGGSMAGLLGQVAAGRGAMMAEGIAGAFGLQTVEEKEAEQTQGIISGIDWNDPESVMAASQKLSEMGLNQAALKVGEKGQQLEAVKRQEEAHQMQMRSQEQQIAIGKQTMKLNEFAISDAELRGLENRRVLEAQPALRAVLANVDLRTPEGQKRALAAAANVSEESFIRMQELITQRQELALSFAEAAAKNNTPPELSKAAEERYMGNMDLISEHASNSTQIDDAITTLEANPWEGGVGKTLEETFKENAGLRNKLSAAITQVKEVALPKAMANLPPGPASDRDVEEVMKTIPPDSAGSGEWLTWLKRVDRISAIQAEYRKAENKHMAEKGSIVGFDQDKAYEAAQGVVDGRIDSKNGLPTIGDLRGELEEL